MKTMQTLWNEERLQIRLLDEPQIKLGETILSFQYRKSLALLAYLATTRKVYSREYLAGFLWGKISETNAQAGLRKIVSEINAYLSPYLLTDNRQIGLNLKLPIDIDVITFEQNILPIRQKPVELVTKEEMEQLEIGLDVYQTGFMPGFYIQKAPAFENWLSIQRGNLQVLMIEALQLASNYTYRIGQFQKSMDYTRRLLVVEPALEEAHYKLMSLLALSGQRSLALSQYDICKKTLLKAYGTFPQAETTALYNRIRLEPEIQQPNKNLPVSNMPILGREEDIQQVWARLCKEQCRILTIMGPGGVGKTHLALMVGKQIYELAKGPFQHGAVFVPLQALQTVQSLSSTIAFQLGYTYDKDIDPTQQLCDYLVPFKLLIVLDNFEQLIPSMNDYAGEKYEFLNRILRAAPGVKLLITSRIRLNLRDEYVYHLQGISYPGNEVSGQNDLQNYPAVALFIQRAEQMLGNYQPDENDFQAIIEICRFVNGLPLGILLAAGWIRLLSAREIADKLMHNDKETSVVFLTSGGSDMPLRHRNMDSVYRQSWDMITPQQQDALAALCIFNSTFSLEAAQSIARIQLMDLIQLIDHSLLKRNDNGRFQIHDLLRQYVTNQDIDIQPAYDRSCDYFSEKIIAWEGAIKGKDQVKAIHEMNLEIDNLRGMWKYAIREKNIACLTKVFEGLCLFYDWRHFYAEGLAFCENITSLLQTNDSFGESLSKKDHLRFLSRALTWQSVFAASSETELLLRQSLSILDAPILQDEDTRSEKAFALHMLAVYISQTGYHDEAFDLYYKSLAIYETLGDDWHLEKILTSFGPLLWDRSAYEEAYQVIERAYHLAKKIGDQRGIAETLIWLGNISLLSGDFRGEKMVRESFSIIEQIGCEMGGVKVRNQLYSPSFSWGCIKKLVS